MARGRVSLSGSFSPRFFMDFCSRGGGVRSAQRCPDRLRRRRALGRGTDAQAGPFRGRTFRSRRGGRGRRPDSARSFWGFGAVSGGAGAAERISTDEQTSGGTWRKKRSAAPGRQTEGEARRIRQRAQPDVSGLSDGGAPGECDGQCIPCDEKFSPPCLKCRTREDEAPDGAAGGLLRAGCPRGLRGRPAWPFSAFTGPPAAQCSLFSSRSRAGAFCVSGGACGPVKIWRDSGEPEKPGDLCRGTVPAPRRGSDKALWRGGALLPVLLA